VCCNAIASSECYLPLVGPISLIALLWRQSKKVIWIGVTGGLLIARASLKRARAPSTLRLIPRTPSASTDGGTDSAADFSSGRAEARVRSLDNATILLTEASGDQGEVCGLRNPDGVVTKVSVNVPVSE
jgi:hypothetical protein